MYFSDGKAWTFFIGIRYINDRLFWADGTEVEHPDALPWLNSMTTTCTYISTNPNIEPAPCTSSYKPICETGGTIDFSVTEKGYSI